MKDVLTKTELFKNLTDDDYASLEQHGQELSFKKNEVFFRKGDPVKSLYLVLEGKVKLYEERKITQREDILSVVDPGDAFDMADVFLQETHHVNAQSIEPGKAIVFPQSVIKELAESSKAFSVNMMECLSRKVIQLSEELADLSLSSTKERLAKYLIREYEFKKRPTRFTLSLNQTQLASHLGTVREIVSRDLASLKKSKVIDSKQGEIAVLNPEELGKIAEGFSFHP